MQDASPPPGHDLQYEHAALGLSDAQVLAALHGMIVARTVDDRLWLLSRQGKAHFVITSAGHEATQFGCAWRYRLAAIMWCRTTVTWRWCWR